MGYAQCLVLRRRLILGVGGVCFALPRVFGQPGSAIPDAGPPVPKPGRSGRKTTALNRWDGSRDSWMRDLDLLATIGSGLVRSVGREPGTCYADFNATIREMREVLKERRNFGVDGRRILPDVMIRWKASMDRLDDYRSQLREVCQPRNIRRI
jgi:hypothetical protein